MYSCNVLYNLSMSACECLVLGSSLADRMAQGHMGSLPCGPKQAQATNSTLTGMVTRRNQWHHS